MRLKACYRTLCIRHCVKRLDLLITFTLALTRTPLGFKLLNVRRVTQHYRAKVAGRFCSVDLSCKAACIQKRQQTRMVDVGVGEQHEVNRRRRTGDFFVLKVVYALLHSEIDKEFLSAAFDICTAARYLVGSAQEYQFHKDSSPRFFKLKQLYHSCQDFSSILHKYFDKLSDKMCKKRKSRADKTTRLFSCFYLRYCTPSISTPLNSSGSIISPKM